MGKFVVGAITIFTLTLGQVANAGGVQAELSQIGDSIHLELKGQSQWNYDLAKKGVGNGTQFQIEVPRLSEPAVMALKKWTNPVLQNLNIQHDGTDGKDVITLTFKGPAMDAFDYMTDQPSRLIVDFYRNTEPKNPMATQAPNPEPRLDESKLPAKKKQVKDNLKSSQDSSRKPSSTDLLTINNKGAMEAKADLMPDQQATDQMSGIFDGGDPNFDRFAIKDYEIKDEAIIASKENYYLDFPMLKIENDELQKLNATQPIYNILPQDNEENKQARLLLTLFENKRYNVFLKAVDWFYQKYPSSKYDEMIRFMRGDTHFAMWLDKHEPAEFDQAMTRYRQALEKYPHSALMERTRMLMGFASMDRGDYLGTLRMFQKHIHDLPQSANKDIARLAMADSYMKLGLYNLAADLYKEITEDAAQAKYKIDATFLAGDVSFKGAEAPEIKNSSEQYKHAIEQYQTALTKYPESAKSFPNALYNQAEAYFKIHQPKEAIKTYLEFLKRFPAHDFAGYAMTRVGELLDMMGADKARSVGAFLETQFRYGDNPSSIVARLRLLSSRMKIMKPKELDKAIDDITALTKKTDLPNIEQFSKVLISDGYASRAEYEDAIQLLSAYYQAHPTTADLNLLNNRIVKFINSEIKSQVDANDFIAALKTHGKYADNRLKGSDRIDTVYNVGRAFELAGVPQEAERLYRDSLNKMHSFKGGSDEIQRNIFERLPSLDEVQLRLSACEMKIGNVAQAYDHLKAIQHPEAMSEAQQIERVQLAAQLLDKKGDLTSASRYLVDLIKTWKGIPALAAAPYLQLADIELKQSKPKDAIESLKQIDQLMLDSKGQVPTNLHFQALQKLGGLYEQGGSQEESAKTYERLLKLYESNHPLASIRYKLGRIYFARGEVQKAADTWNGLKGEKTEFWYGLAQEQLKNKEWNGEYKKYIERIPAMATKNE